MDRANGVIVRAYLVKGVNTVVHMATLEAVRLGGRFNVICSLTSEPNMVYPQTAMPPYTSRQMTKLANRTCQKVRQDDSTKVSDEVAAQPICARRPQPRDIHN